MKEGPDIAVLGALIGDPARANMLNALLGGKALTASELAAEAGITPQTASAHLAKLQNGGLLAHRKQGRHRYFALADAEIAELLERMGGVSTHIGLSRTRTGPKDPAMRKARVCYNHLAGEFGVHIYDSMMARQFLCAQGDGLGLTAAGLAHISGFGIDVEGLKIGRRPLTKPCLDWSARRSHLAGALGTALLGRIYDLGWAKRIANTRVVDFSPKGEKALMAAFPL